MSPNPTDKLLQQLQGFLDYLTPFLDASFLTKRIRNEKDESFTEKLVNLIKK